MSQPYKSGRQQNLNLGITSVTESRTVLQTIGKVGIGTTNAQQHSLFVVGSTNITGDIRVGGASTFVGVGTFNNDLYVANQLYVGGVSISGGATVGADIVTRNLLASGISTLTGQVNASGGLDVVGHTELDNLNVSGIATINNLNVQTGFDVYDTQAVFHNNVRIDGNLSIGGTTTVIQAQDLKIFDKEITLGITTNAFGQDISTDDTANHGGIAIASTEGSPLVDLTLVGYSTMPSTYKQLMWVAANSYGIGTTDAWMFNYAVGIGSTIIPNGVRFAVRDIQFTDDTINTPNINASKTLNVSGTSALGVATASQLYVSGVSTFVGVGTFQNDLYIGGDLYVKDDIVVDEITSRNLNVTGLTTVGVVSAISVNATGIITANTFRPSSGYIQAADGTNSFYIYNGSGNVAFQGTIGASSINNGQGYQAINFTTTSTPTVLIPNDLNVSGLSTFTGLLDANGGLTVDNIRIGVADDNTIDTSIGNLTLDSFAGTVNITDQLNVSGISTFQNNVIFQNNGYFGDGDTLHFGDGNDLQIYHANVGGGLNYIRDYSTGLRITSNNFEVYSSNLFEKLIGATYNGSVDLYHDGVKRLETTGYGVTVYSTIQAPQINVTGISTFVGFSTFRNNVSVAGSLDVNGNINFNGDLFQDNQPFIASRWLATTNGLDIYRLSNVGIGTSTLLGALTVRGDANVSGVITATTFNGQVNAGVGTITTLISTNATITNINSTGIATLGIVTASQLYVSGVSTLATLHAPKLTYNGSDFGAAGFIAKADGSGGWTWVEAPGLFSVNNILNGFIVKDEGTVVGTAGSITTIDFVGSNIIATADPQPNGIATVRLSDTPTFDSLVVSTGITTLGVTTSTSLFSNQLSVSGLSTFIGVGTFRSDLYVGGNLYIQNDLVFDEATVRNINVTGVSTLGIASATTLFVSGISTFNNIVNIGSAITAYPATGIISATAFYGDGSNLANTGSTLNAASGTQRLVLTSQTTGTMTQSATNSDLVYNSSTNTLSGTNFAPTQLSVSGVSTFTGAISTGTTTGFSGQYLQSTGVGVTWATFPTLRTTQTNVATNGQTSFSFSYNVNFLDVFVNGVKLTSSEYTASNGSTITLSSPAFANDIVEFVSYNTTSTGGSGGGGASILDDLTDVALNLPPQEGENLTYNGSNWVNDYTVTATTTTTSQTTLHSLSASSYRSVEYMIQATEGTKYHVTKVLAIHDGTVAYPTEYGTLYTNGSLGTFDVDISGGNMRLRVTPASSASTSYKIKFTAIKV